MGCPVHLGVDNAPDEASPLLQAGLACYSLILCAPTSEWGGPPAPFLPLGGFQGLFVLVSLSTQEGAALAKGFKVCSMSTSCQSHVSSLAPWSGWVRITHPNT